MLTCRLVNAGNATYLKTTNPLEYYGFLTLRPFDAVIALLGFVGLFQKEGRKDTAKAQSSEARKHAFKDGISVMGIREIRTVVRINRHILRLSIAYSC